MGKTCFVVSPIGEEGTAVRKKSDNLFKYIIKLVCDEAGLECIRSDHVQKSDIITSTVIDYLNNADIVVADMTGHNPNVFYEMGYRYALEKPIIQMKDKDTSIPFDLGAIRTISYNLTDLEAVEKAIDELRGYISNSLAESAEQEPDDTKIPLESVVIERLDKVQDQIAALVRLNEVSYSSVRLNNDYLRKLGQEMSFSERLRIWNEGGSAPFSRNELEAIIAQLTRLKYSSTTVFEEDAQKVTSLVPEGSLSTPVV